MTIARNSLLCGCGGSTDMSEVLSQKGDSDVDRRVDVRVPVVVVDAARILALRSIASSREIHGLGGGGEEQ